MLLWDFCFEIFLKLSPYFRRSIIVTVYCLYCIHFIRAKIIAVAMFKDCIIQNFLKVVFNSKLDFFFFTSYFRLCNFGSIFLLLVIQSGPVKSIFSSQWLTCTRNVPHPLSATFKMVTILSEKHCANNLICGEGQIEGGVWEFQMKAGTSRCICPLLNNSGAVIQHEWHWHTIPQPLPFPAIPQVQ